MRTRAPLLPKIVTLICLARVQRGSEAIAAVRLLASAEQMKLEAARAQSEGMKGLYRGLAYACVSAARLVKSRHP